MAALSAASITVFQANAASDLTQLALWVPIGLGSLLVTMYLLLMPDKR